jgi:hypothetical protein
MSEFLAHRGFLKASLAVLTGAGAPATLSPPAWADMDVTPGHSQELLARLQNVDGISVQAEENLQPPRQT